MSQLLDRPWRMALTDRQESPGTLSIEWIDSSTAEVTNHNGIVRVRPRGGCSQVCFTPTSPTVDVRSVVVECPWNLRLQGWPPENLEGKALPFTLVFQQNAQEAVVALPLSKLEVAVDSAEAHNVSRVITFERNTLFELKRLNTCRGRWTIRNQFYDSSSELVDLELGCRLTDGESAAVVLANGCPVQISRLEADAGHVDLENARFAAGIEIIQPQLSLSISQQISDVSIECRELELKSRPSNSRIVAHEKLALKRGAEHCDIQANKEAALSGVISKSSIRVSGETAMYSSSHADYYGHCSLEDSREVDFARNVTLSELTVSAETAVTADAADPSSLTAAGTVSNSSSEMVALSFGGHLTVERGINIQSATLKIGDQLPYQRLKSTTAASPDTSASEHAISMRQEVQE